ncbi:hypothetical protein RVR_6609 [Actinacidiphila reveromycinica]|uniref:Uncharacterized protein n=2 Tax=Actinacidiphila reveromycinica TaxID=659352 RepID=A0A7U3VQK3_9ACTN|nr:hypothetical protein RVR_6609 [Streptomyces sp. SN-593]
MGAGARQFGMAIDVAGTGSIVTGTGRGFVSSSRTAWTVLGTCGVLATILGALSTSAWAQETAVRNGRRLATEIRQPAPRQTQLNH